MRLDQHRRDIHDIRIGQLKESMAGVADRYEEVIDRLGQAEEDAIIFRELLWMNHGHTGMYGDDGEMQCAECFRQFGFFDWKRIPIKEIQEKITLAVLKDAKGE